MITEKALAVLRRHPFVDGFRPGHVEALAGLASTTFFDGDHVILREGDESLQLYLITSGLVALEMTGPRQPFRVDTLTAGDEFGWSWAISKAGVFQARTLEPTEAVVFQGADLRSMCEADTAFGYALMRRLLGVVSGRLQATRLQLLDTFWPVAARAGA